jgi:hypothetical protein
MKTLTGGRLNVSGFNQNKIREFKPLLIQQGPVFLNFFRFYLRRMSTNKNAQYFIQKP